MPNLNLSLSTRRPFGRQWAGRRGLREVINWLQAVASGEVQSDSVWYNTQDAVALGASAYPGQAAGVFILSDAAANAVTADVCGVTISVDAGGAPSAANSITTQTAWCALVRSTSTTNRKVTACNRVASATLATVLAGSGLSVCGVRFTAIDGTVSKVGEFDMSGNDTADALSLATAINRHPSLAGRVRAVSNAAVVYIALLETRDPLPGESVVSYASTITVASGTFGANAVGMVLAQVAGDIGNEVRFANATGTGASLATNGSAGFLGQGTGGGTTNVSCTVKDL